MTHWLFCLPLLALGCSSLGHASDPTVDGYLGDACALLGEQNKAALEAKAAREGLSFQDVLDGFKAACAIRLRAGIEPARQAGLAAPDGGAP